MEQRKHIVCTFRTNSIHVLLHLVVYNSELIPESLQFYDTAEEPMRESFTTEETGQWGNRNHSISLSVERLVELWPPYPPRPTTVLTDVQATADTVRRLIGQVRNAGGSMRAYGGGLSLSAVATSPHLMVNTRHLTLKYPIDYGCMDSKSSYHYSNLFYFQCGTLLPEVYRYLEGRGRTLPTSGTCTNQTLGGAVSTGTHASAHHFGSVSDAVVAIHVITGPEPDDVLWLERATLPAVTHNFADRIGARLVRNDDLFNTALISFGSCGFVMGFLVNTIPLHKIKAVRRTIFVGSGLDHILQTLDFDALHTFIPSVNSTSVNDVTFVVNPHNSNGTVHCTVMERVELNTATIPAPANTDIRPGTNMLGVVGLVGNTSPELIPQSLHTLLDKSYKDVGPFVDTPVATYRQPTVFGMATSTEVGIPLQHTAAVLHLLRTIGTPLLNYAGIFAIRYIKQTRAFLGMAQFPITAVIELPGVKCQGTHDFHKAVFHALKSASVPFTFHWGMEMPEGPEALVHYGANKERWIKARRELLGSNRTLFDNDVTRALGLSD